MRADDISAALASIDAFLSGSLDPIEAARALAGFHDDTQQPELQSAFLALIAVESETDAILTGDRRGLWHPEVRSREDARHDEAQAWAHPIVQDACERLSTILRRADREAG